MKSRERLMAYVVLGLIALTAIGVVYFMYYDRSMTRLNLEERRARQELQQAEKELAEIENSMPRLRQAKRMSLPKDLNTARFEYGKELESMLKSSSYPSGKITITPRPPENRSTGPTSKKQMFTRLLYEIKAQGDLRMLTEFLDRFYRTPLLHRVKNLTVTRPLTRMPDQIPGELEVIMTVEALILDGAEDRKKLLPEGLKEADRPPRLARTSAQYATIAGNNVFFGPMPPPEPPPELLAGARGAWQGVLAEFEGPKRADFNVLAEIVLDSITHDDKGAVATLFDGASEYRYVVRKRYDGTFRIDKYFFNAKGDPKPLEIGEKVLAFKDANEFMHRTFKVVRIDATDLLLEEKEKFYRLHVGWRVSEVQLLTKDEAGKLGLMVKEENKGDKGKEKPEDKKVGKEPPAGETAKKVESK